jgi:DNA-binding NarL/FixJ family response regulator
VPVKPLFSSPLHHGVMSRRIPVFVYAHDPVLQAGVASQLRGHPDIEVVQEDRPDDAVVAIVVADIVDDNVVTVIRGIQRNGVPRVVAVLSNLDTAGVIAGVEAGACGLIRRAEATTARLVEAVRSAANGDGTLSPDLLGGLLSRLGNLQQDVLRPLGLSFTGLNPREVEVLRLVADGLDTDEIADKLCYSPRTVKNVLHDITIRYHLKNRSHAVAFALRQGLI